MPYCGSGNSLDFFLYSNVFCFLVGPRGLNLMTTQETFGPLGSGFAGDPLSATSVCLWNLTDTIEGTFPASRISRLSQADLR